MLLDVVARAPTRSERRSRGRQGATPPRARMPMPAGVLTDAISRVLRRGRAGDARNECLPGLRGLTLYKWHQRRFKEKATAHHTCLENAGFSAGHVGAVRDARWRSRDKKSADRAHERATTHDARPAGRESALPTPHRPKDVRHYLWLRRGAPRRRAPRRARARAPARATFATMPVPSSKAARGVRFAARRGERLAVRAADETAEAPAEAPPAPAPPRARAREGFSKICAFEDPPRGDRKKVDALGKSILIFWYKDTVVCIEGRSPAEGAFSEGFANARLTQDVARVSGTASTFDLKTGRSRRGTPRTPAASPFTFDGDVPPRWRCSRGYAPRRHLRGRQKRLARPQRRRGDHPARLDTSPAPQRSLSGGSSSPLSRASSSSAAFRMAPHELQPLGLGAGRPSPSAGWRRWRWPGPRRVFYEHRRHGRFARSARTSVRALPAISRSTRARVSTGATRQRKHVRPFVRVGRVLDRRAQRGDDSPKRSCTLGSRPPRRKPAPRAPQRERHTRTGRETHGRMPRARAAAACATVSPSARVPAAGAGARVGIDARRFEKHAHRGLYTFRIHFRFTRKKKSQKKRVQKCCRKNYSESGRPSIVDSRFREEKSS